ncbi:DNA-directed RNA polymerase III subunit RPC5 [Linnemannia schmuckeri]|uniref:DNA-directed RNA polymerase III subunit RPC5 n=1 Tax=Linnemannia schmuckeri TaxID=64567 RepID=A0A9P5S7Q5_9FUNG|nr:DNA-directed RNA polymerase III subunit RPC5 [Linnemannia schmuckeri]
MPPKISIKPKISATARIRKRVIVEEEGSEDHDANMQDDGVADEGDVMEDALQEQERLEEERLNRDKVVKREGRQDAPQVMAVSSASKTKDIMAERVYSAEPTPDFKSTQESSAQDDSLPAMEGLEGSADSDSFDNSADQYQDHNFSVESGGERLPDYADEGDELVKDIPVYLSQRLAKYLYLFQYPVRAAALPYSEGSGPSKARIKPLSQLIELELPVDTNASQYNKERGEELAMGMNDKALRTALDDEPDDDEKRELLDKQTLVSSLIPNATNYLAGVLRNDEIHLTPIHGAVQLRPSFKYLDKIDEKKKQASKKISDEENKELLAKQKAEQEQKARALQVQVRSAADSEARRTSGPNKARLAEEENWTKLDYFDAETRESALIYDRMFASYVDELDCVTTVSDYLGLVSSNNSLRNVKTEPN